jgi:hypothetical protein
MRKMAASKKTLAQLASAFDVAVAMHQEELTKVQDMARLHKEECDRFLRDMAQRYDTLADTVQWHLDKVSQMMGGLQPKIQEFLRHANQPANPTKKRPHTRKAGRA